MHGAVIIGFMPALTAACAVMRAGERPSLGFWIACLFGAASVLGFALVTGAGHFGAADLLLVAAAVLCSYGYTEGALVARAIGGWRVVTFGQALLLPLTLPAFALVIMRMPQPLTHTVSAWVAFGDLIFVSALFGFFVWYMGLAVGGVARVGQLQLLQLPLSCLWSVAFLGEHLDLPTVLAAACIICSAGLTVAMRGVGPRRASVTTAAVPA
jgi:drug/metabolite transporter (DMT)-like permease